MIDLHVGTLREFVERSANAVGAAYVDLPGRVYRRAESHPTTPADRARYHSGRRQRGKCTRCSAPSATARCEACKAARRAVRRAHGRGAA